MLNALINGNKDYYNPNKFRKGTIVVTVHVSDKIHSTFKLHFGFDGFTTPHNLNKNCLLSICIINSFGTYLLDASLEVIC